MALRLRVEFWWWLHRRAGSLARRLAPPVDANQGHPLWRLTDWAAYRFMHSWQALVARRRQP